MIIIAVLLLQLSACTNEGNTSLSFYYQGAIPYVEVPVNEITYKLQLNTNLSGIFIFSSAINTIGKGYDCSVTMKCRKELHYDTTYGRDIEYMEAIIDIEGKEVSLPQIPVKIVTSWPFPVEMDGVFGIGLKEYSNLINYFRQNDILPIYSFSNKLSKMVIGSYNLDKFCASSVMWVLANDNSWHVPITKVSDTFDTSHNYENYILEFTNGDNRLPINIYDSYIVSYLKSINCYNAGYNFECKISYRHESGMPELQLIFDKYKVDIPFTAYTNNLTTSRAWTNNKITNCHFNVDTIPTDGNIIKHSIQELLSHHVLIFDIENKKIGFALVEPTWGDIAIGILVTIVILIIGCACPKKRRR